ncbi:DUF4159 domain-containing protein [Candidatus Poribacteria bacterium]
MRRSATINRGITLNSFLISLFLNLALLLVLSLIEEHIDPQAEDSIAVKFVSLPKTIPQRRSLELPPKQISISVPRDVEPNTARVKPMLRTREISLPQSGPVTPTNVNPESYHDPDRPSSPLISRPRSVSPLSSPVGSLRRTDGVPSEPARRETGGQIESAGRGIEPRQPMAGISGSGEGLSGYYNISLVRYEDTSDTISTDALKQLAGAMNRWTKIKTKVIGKPIMLDDPELLRVPLVYITSRRAFAFSERERENLRKYLTGGGFLLFSNAADSESEARGVANSIEFELWKALAGSVYDLSGIDKKHEVYDSFFDLSGSLKLRGVAANGRFGVVYEDSGYGAGWVAGKDSKREPYLKLGVNIIAYALTTSPLVISHQ